MFGKSFFWRIQPHSSESRLSSAEIELEIFLPNVSIEIPQSFLMKPPDASRVNVSPKSQLFPNINPKFSGLSGTKWKSHLLFRFHQRALTFITALSYLRSKRLFSNLSYHAGIIRILYSPGGLPWETRTRIFFLPKSYDRTDELSKEQHVQVTGTAVNLKYFSSLSFNDVNSFHRRSEEIFPDGEMKVFEKFLRKCGSWTGRLWCKFFFLYHNFLVHQMQCSWSTTAVVEQPSDRRTGGRWFMGCKNNSHALLLLRELKHVFNLYSKFFLHVE